MNILIFLIILLVLVLSHEFGHFIVAKKSGIRVDEFSFGFKPKLFGIKKGGTEYNFNAIPFGGYVKIYGENPDEENINGPDKNRSFVNKPRYIQALVLVAGVVMNLLVAWLLLSVGYMSGLPTSVSSAPQDANIKDKALTVISILPDSPAEKAGMEVGDKILSIKSNEDVLENPILTEDVSNFIKNKTGEDLEISYKRGNDINELTVTPSLGIISNQAAIGISMDVVGKLHLPIHKAIWEGSKLTWNVTKETTIGFFNLIKEAILGKADMNSITGPIGIVGVVGDAREFGFVYLLSFTALISINLAVINLVPFPALDGGRLLFLLIEKIKGSRIKPSIANWVNTIGFGILMLLMVIVTFHDLIKLF